MEDVGAAAVACLAQPEEHNGQTYRLGYQAATYHDIARIFTEVIGQLFRMKRAHRKSSIGTSSQPAYSIWPTCMRPMRTTARREPIMLPILPMR
jgi:hypothetical protein